MPGNLWGFNTFDGKNILFNSLCQLPERVVFWPKFAFYAKNKHYFETSYRFLQNGSRHRRINKFGFLVNQAQWGCPGNWCPFNKYGYHIVDYKMYVGLNPSRVQNPWRVGQPEKTGIKKYAGCLLWFYRYKNQGKLLI